MIPINRAVFDPTMKYRYLLTREWAEDHGRMCFIMLNPSTADADHDDATIRSCVRIARQYAGAIDVVNLFAYRSTDPKELLRVDNPIGPDNNEHIIDALTHSTIIIAAWGDEKPFMRQRAKDMRCYLYNEGFRAMCFGLTKNNSPRHPLYLATNTPLHTFR